MTRRSREVMIPFDLEVTITRTGNGWLIRLPPQWSDSDVSDPLMVAETPERLVEIVGEWARKAQAAVRARQEIPR